jgi:hypothetical protein
MGSPKGRLRSPFLTWFTHLNGSVCKALGASANSAAFIDLPGPQT